MKNAVRLFTLFPNDIFLFIYLSNPQFNFLIAELNLV